MADFKKFKQVRSKENPQKGIITREDPDRFLNEHPSWNFSSCDLEVWCFDKENLGDKFWDEILPRMKSLETQKWSEILIAGKKENHSISVKTLNNVAIKRLDNRKIESEDIVSLRIQGTHRIYGLISGSVFNILWFDDNHGDNEACVCRSKKKHT